MRLPRQAGATASLSHRRLGMKPLPVMNHSTLGHPLSRVESGPQLGTLNFYLGQWVELRTVSPPLGQPMGELRTLRMLGVMAAPDTRLGGEDGARRSRQARAPFLLSVSIERAGSDAIEIKKGPTQAGTL